jgi:type III pantothenate kinase
MMPAAGRACTVVMQADFLLVDVGNSSTKLALASADEAAGQGAGLLQRRDLPTAGTTPQTIAQALTGWSFGRVVLSSVVPAATAAWKQAQPGLLELRHDSLLGIGIDYPQPQSIGPDRLANAVALAHLYGAPGIGIDFGTAVTFDILSAQRSYLGGVIAPGLRLMTDYLHERTALLPKVELAEPISAIGRSTVGAIQAGAALGYRGMVQGILAALRAELGGGQIRVVATGGDASWIVGGMPELGIVVDEDLTLKGLRLVGLLAQG